MTTKTVHGNDLKSGSYVLIEGAPCKIVDIQISKPGKHGHAKMRIEGMGMLDGRRRVMVMPSHDTVEVPMIEKRSAQVLSVLGDTANVMDSETYETFDLKIPEELKDKCTAGTSVLYWKLMDERLMRQVKGEGKEEEE